MVVIASVILIMNAYYCVLLIFIFLLLLIATIKITMFITVVMSRIIVTC